MSDHVCPTADMFELYEYLCACACVRVCRFMCMYACIFVCMHASVHVCIHGRMHVCMHVHVCLYVCRPPMLMDACMNECIIACVNVS